MDIFPTVGGVFYCVNCRVTQLCCEQVHNMYFTINTYPGIQIFVRKYFSHI